MSWLVPAWTILSQELIYVSDWKRVKVEFLHRVNWTVTNIKVDPAVLGVLSSGLSSGRAGEVVRRKSSKYFENKNMPGLDIPILLLRTGIIQYCLKVWNVDEPHKSDQSYFVSFSLHSCTDLLAVFVLLSGRSHVTGLCPRQEVW